MAILSKGNWQLEALYGSGSYWKISRKSLINLSTVSFMDGGYIKNRFHVQTSIQ